MRVTGKHVWGVLTRVTLLTFQFMSLLHLNEGYYLPEPSGEDGQHETEAEWIRTKDLTRPYDEELTQNLPEEAFLPKIQSISIKSKIRFRYARTRIISTVVNPLKKSQSVNFSLRIPKEAFITRFEMRVDGDDPIKANITRDEEAREAYKIAKAEGRSVTLGLLENKNEDFEDFSMKLIVGAGKTVLLKLLYEERLQRKFKIYEHIIRVVPDYITDKTSYRMEVLIEENELAKNVKAFYPNQEIGSSPGSCESTYGNATVEYTKDNATRLVWESVDEKGNQRCKNWTGEFGVMYSLEDFSPAGHVLVRDGYFVHFFAPPDLKPLRKHVVFVLDKSDSMDGSKLEQLKDAMINILDSLRLHDYFNLIAFSNNAEVWTKFKGRGGQYLYPYPAAEEYKDSARFWVNQYLSAGGSTNIHLALMTALELCRNVSSVEKNPTPVKFGRLEFPPQNLPPEVQSMIIFLTDGDPTSGIVSKPQILRSIKLANHELKVPIYSLAFGKEPDFHFLKSLSLKNRGFVRQIYENAHAEVQLSDFYAEISSPVLSNVTFEYITPSPPQINLIDSFVKPGFFPIVFDGTEIVIAKKLSDVDFVNTSNLSRLTVSVAGNSANGKTHYDVPVTDCRLPGVCRGDSTLDDMVMEKLFVYMTIQKLTEGESADKAMYTGDDLCTKYGDESYDDYDRQYRNCTANLKKKAVEMALQYGFVIPGTAALMKTRSILDEELDVSIVKGEEWEVFLGSEIPAIPGSKQISVQPLAAGVGERYIAPERLPQPEALSSDSVFQESHVLTEQHYEYQSLSSEQQNLTLRDISWLSLVDLSKPVASFSMANRKGIDITYLVASEGWLIEYRHALGGSQNWSSSGLECKRDSKRTCTHLANCIMSVFSKSLALYKESYWCPMSFEDNLYLGVCCLEGSKNSTAT